MSSKRVLLAIVALLAFASLAVAAAWQYAAESVDSRTAVVAPASRSMFPKVLNH